MHPDTYWKQVTQDGETNYFIASTYEEYQLAKDTVGCEEITEQDYRAAVAMLAGVSRL